MNGTPLVVTRAILIAVTALVAYLYYMPLGHTDFKGQWGDGTYGVFTEIGSTDVIEVLPNSPGQKAGVRVGDHLDATVFTRQWISLGSPIAGERHTFAFVRPDRTRYTASMTAIAVPGFTIWNRIGGILSIIPATIFLIIAFILVYLRPSAMTWSFYVYAVGYFSTAPAFGYFSHVFDPTTYIVMTFVLTTVCGSWAVMPLIPFVLRFPYNQLNGWQKRLDTIVWIALAGFYVAFVYDWFTFMYQHVRAPFYDFIQTWLPLGTFAAAVAILISRFREAPPQEKQRWIFLEIGMLVSFVAYAIYYVPGVQFAVAQIVGYAAVLLPIVVAYAVLRHRILDINFVLNRAIAYATVSIIVIAFVSTLDWFASNIVSQQRFATLASLLVTIGIGFALDRINRSVGNAIEAVLFRKRRAAEKYMRRASAALPFATGENAITDGLVHEPVDALLLSAAALYRRSQTGARFDGVATSNEATVAPHGFDADHPLVRFLKAEEDIVWLHDLRTHLDAANSSIYVLAVPVLVRHELESFVLYGAHRNGAMIDPDEVELLQELAREAARAYDHVEAVRMRELLAKFTQTHQPQTIAAQ